jgi:Glycoside-hydrolase family GH114
MWAPVLLVALAAGHISGRRQSTPVSEGDNVALEPAAKLEKRQLLGSLFGGLNGTGGYQDVQRWDHRAKGHSFQIILEGALDLKPEAKSVTPDVDVYDVDLFFTDTSTIKTLHQLGKTVICYFSAGTYEPGRPDSALFPMKDIGSRLIEWPEERWVRTGSASIRRIMADRIQLAAQKGCDAIDADNVDAYGTLLGGGLGLMKTDSISIVMFLAATAAKYGMANGLKNGLEIMPLVQGLVQFAVNEQCASKLECNKYTFFRKPVFHIEYPLGSLPGSLLAVSASAVARSLFCPEVGIIQRQFHTVLKVKKLDGAVRYCDGEFAVTPTKPVNISSRFSATVNTFAVPGDEAAENVLDDGPEAGPRSQAKAWRNSSEAIKLQEEIAKQDGYPFRAGTGSETVVPDSELGAYQ